MEKKQVPPKGHGKDLCPVCQHRYFYKNGQNLFYEEGCKRVFHKECIAFFIIESVKAKRPFPVCACGNRLKTEGLFYMSTLPLHKKDTIVEKTAPDGCAEWNVYHLLTNAYIEKFVDPVDMPNVDNIISKFPPWGALWVHSTVSMSGAYETAILCKSASWTPLDSESTASIYDQDGVASSAGGNEKPDLPTEPQRTVRLQATFMNGETSEEGEEFEEHWVIWRFYEITEQVVNLFAGSCHHKEVSKEFKSRHEGGQSLWLHVVDVPATNRRLGFYSDDSAENGNLEFVDMEEVAWDSTIR